ncbi:hypothetical protein GCM10010967_26480 [Dyadobacter beijingensis]|uniref:Uncharacterized protein n=1 Tax=Dyadobacter beijingensis TaxID=365489 RepID=A0ABQ2HUN8_9BACT|nr:hypothetical protein [Dyadobacter beijingensis]GGM92116.1 hypothetical protein GCM10010967_26480 [Dyadobacter beijingensis]
MTIYCKITHHTHVFQPGNIVEVRRRILEKSPEVAESGYFIPDTGDGTPGIIPLSAAEPITGQPPAEEAYYGKCVLTKVMNFYPNPADNQAPGPVGVVKPENVRIVHYHDCQQLFFHMPQYAWDAGTLRITNTCPEVVLEEKRVRDRLNGGTMILINTLPYPPGCYTIDADWPDGWTHRICFIKFTEGFPKAPYENAPANIYRAIRNEEVHLLPLPEPEKNEKPTFTPKPKPYEGYESPAGNMHIVQNDHEYRLFDSNGVEMEPAFDTEKLRRDLMSRFLPTLEYTQEGRGGTIYYQEGDIRFGLDWEFGGGNAVVIFYIPEVKYWEAQTRTPLSRRDEIIEFICRQVIRDQAPGCTYKIYHNSVSILH